MKTFHHFIHIISVAFGKYFKNNVDRQKKFKCNILRNVVDAILRPFPYSKQFLDNEIVVLCFQSKLIIKSYTKFLFKKFYINCNVN